MLVQFDQVSGGAVPFFLNKADVVLFLELGYFVFAVAQIFFHLNELLGNPGGYFVAAVFPHASFEIEIFLHGRVQIGLGVFRRATDCGKIEDRRPRFLENEYLHRDRLQLGMC